jgi:predicted phage baseplate assembly protein
MARGRLDLPNLDDRTWREIAEQARALIPQYAPEWTDYNPSDLGITLIELFAWIVEGMIYRLNRVPERSEIQFLNLLGSTRAPARPAATWLTFALTPDTGATKVPAGTQVTTPQTEQAAPVVFETDTDLIVLPINLKKVLLIDNTGVHDVTSILIAAQPGVPVTTNTQQSKELIIDLAATASATIALGFDRSRTETLTLHLQRAQAAGADACQCSWHYATAGKKPSEWPAITAVNDGTSGLRRSGSVELTVPTVRRLGQAEARELGPQWRRSNHG